MNEIHTVIENITTMMIPVSPQPFEDSRRGMKKNPMVEYALAIQSYYAATPRLVIFYIEMPSTWSSKKKCKHEGLLTESGPDIWLLAKAFMYAISKNDTHSHLPQFEKRYGTPGIFVD